MFLTTASLLGSGLVVSTCISLMNVPDNGAFVLGVLGALVVVMIEFSILKRIWSV